MTGTVAAIDFGTTYTTAAVRDTGGVDMVMLDHHETRLPSLVLRTCAPGGTPTWVVGWAASNQAALFPASVERTPKRRIGVDADLLLGDQMVPVVDAVAAVLHEVWRVVVAQRPDVSGVVLTHPAAWSSRRTDLLLQAAALAGIPGTPRLCPEPVAAAMAYAAHRPESRDLVAVYDLGGGTIDVAVLAADGDDYRLVAPPGGDQELGGEDFDERVFAHLCEQLARQDSGVVEKLRSAPEREWRIAAEQLRLEARRAKEALSTSSSYALYVPQPVGRDLILNERELRDLISADIARTVELLADVVEAGQGASGLAVTGIYLVGGSSRIPAVQHMIEARLGLPCLTWENPKDVVARGATRWAPAPPPADGPATHAPPPAARPAAAPAVAEQPATVVPEPAATAAAEPGPAWAATGPQQDVRWAGTLRGRLAVVRGDDAHTEVSLVADGVVRSQIGLLGAFRGAATGDSALLVVTQAGRRATAYVVDPQLAIRTSASLGSMWPRWVLAAGSLAWVVGDVEDRVPAGPEIGLPWGDVGRAALWRIDLAAVLDAGQPRLREEMAVWRVNDGHLGLLLDPASATTVPPLAIPTPDGRGAFTWVVGQFASRRSLSLSPARIVNRDVSTSQLLVTDGGGDQPWQGRRTGDAWIHQFTWSGTSHLAAGSAGVGVLDQPVLGRRPDLGACTLLPTSLGTFAVVVDRILEDSPTTIGTLDDSALTVLARFDTSPLLHPCSSARQPTPVVHQGALVMPIRVDDSTMLASIRPDGQGREHGPYPGWWEPIGSVGAGLVCRHAPQVWQRPTDPPPERFDVETLMLD